MPIAQGDDLTKNAIGIKRSTGGFRPVAGSSYPVGALVQQAAIDAQIFPDYKTVIPVAASQRAKKLIGIVSEEWTGFDQNLSTVAAGTAASQVNVRGTQAVNVTQWGFHSAVLIDNSNAGANTITDGVMLASSQQTAGKCQGDTAPVVGATIGWAALPAAGIGSSLGAGANAAAAQTATIGGVPAQGDVYSVTVQIPYIMSAPGVAQTRTVSTAPLTSGQAASTTTAATALQQALAADSVLTKYYTPTSAAAVVTVTAIQTAIFSVYHATPYTNTGLPFDPGGFRINLSGTVGNSLTFSTAAAGAGTNTAGGATLAGGTGYIGICPAWLILGGA